MKKAVNDMLLNFAEFIFVFIYFYFILFLQVKKAVNDMQLDFAEKFLKIAKDQDN